MKTSQMTRAVLPRDSNQKGVLFGGTLMAWMDELSGIAARRFAGTDVTTAAVENIRFLKPIPLGAFVDVTAEVVGVGRTSMKVRVRTMMDGETGENDMLVAEAMFIYVTLNKEIISDRADQLQ